MFGYQRLQRIREIILKQEFVDVQTLSEELGVSDVTIRRDLDKLEKEGFVIKSYGGAVLNKDYFPGKINSTNKLLNVEDDEGNKLISKIAINMIQDEQVVFLGGGPISKCIANGLCDKKKLVVITNDIFIGAELYNKPNIRVTITGGDLVTDSGIMVGPYVLRMLSEIHVDIAFIEIKGIDLKFGYSMESFDEVEVVKGVINISDETVAMANHKNFNKISFTKLGDLNMFDKLITNKEVPDDYKEYYYENCTKLYTTYEFK